MQSKELKYIIFDNFGIPSPIIFPSNTGVMHRHIDVSNCKPISAGLCKLDGQNTICYGNSPSLHLESRPNLDAEIIKKYYYDNGLSTN